MPEKGQATCRLSQTGLSVCEACVMTTTSLSIDCMIHTRTGATSRESFWEGQSWRWVLLLGKEHDHYSALGRLDSAYLGMLFGAVPYPRKSL